MKRAYIAVLILLVFSLIFLPVLAEARGGHGGGHGGGRGTGRSHGRCGHGKVHGGFHGGASGVFIGGAYLAPPAYETYPACYEMVPEHMESQWAPVVQGYVDVLVPEQFVPVPCPKFKPQSAITSLRTS